ncbi:MAG: glycoside hydrolase family 125 protein [Candidatus Eremiobacteraeota bacterium]|nr:glycoside hydrolase family 125 protein [Candidatus Eremiobacteraeota bacterium]
MSPDARSLLRPAVLSLLILFSSFSVSSGADVLTVYAHAADVNAGLFFKTSDSTTYVSTGDIDAMWLRDSSVQSLSLLHDRRLIRGVISRQERLIALDPYANAFHRDYSVAEQKFELDSLCYPVRLADRYVHDTGDDAIFDRGFFSELQIILHTVLVEQHHGDHSRYHRNEHSFKEGIGLVWSAYRPSDDPQVYNYNIPENMFTATTLHTMADFFRRYYHDNRSANKAELAAERIAQAIEEKGIFTTRHGRIYAYEIDGLGHAKFMDDANVPSLLSLPLLGYHYDRDIYVRTRQFILSTDNPYFYRGHYAAGIGSPHTPTGFVWPMSLIVQYRTSDDGNEKNRIRRQLALSAAGDGALHESFNVNDPRRYTRPKFGWVNALFEQTFLSN